jgi:hypothetical protein
MSRSAIFLALAVALGSCALPAADLQFTDKGELIRPPDYREWVFLASGLGMTYGPNRPQAGESAPFNNVFVNPEAWRAFMKSGKWPDGTLFMLEIRHAQDNVSISSGGKTQGALRAMEAAVKDTQRYPDGGWAYFSFDSPQGLTESAAPFPRTAGCYSCHKKHGAVEWTFTQFYPTAFEVAQRLGTVRRDYDPARKAE